MTASLNHLLTRLVPLLVLMASLSAERAPAQLSDDNVVRGGLPAAFNWCDYDVCTPVRQQLGPRCAHYALNGAFEACINIVHGPNDALDLSEQWTSSCAGSSPGFYLITGAHTDECGGYGAVLEADFPYDGPDPPCDCPYPHHHYLKSWGYVDPYEYPSVEDVKYAIYHYGPVITTFYTNPAFWDYEGGVFEDCDGTGGTHDVVLVGWDDNQGEEGVWFLRNSYGTDWGEEGYMRIPYGCLDVERHTRYLEYDPEPALVFEYHEGRPTMLDPEETTEFPVTILGVYDAIPDPDTATLHYALNEGEWHHELLTHIGGDEYPATLPAASCADICRWYISAQNAMGGQTFYNPWDAPETSYSASGPHATAHIFIDDFESDRSWEVSGDATIGNWELADPEEVTIMHGAVITQPEDDHTPDGTLCYVTGPLAGENADDYDVDDGATRLMSPVIDLSGLDDPTVSYWRWYYLGPEVDDVFLVQVSNDDGASWVTVESIVSRGPWTYAEWKVNDYVTPTDQVRVRFTAADLLDASLVEALIDDFKITAPVCVVCLGDLDYDDDVDLADLSELMAHYGMTGGARYEYGDLDFDGDVDLSDLSAMLAIYGSDCQ